MRIALITPLRKEDYLTNTVIDGLRQMPEHEARDARADMAFAARADLVLLFWGKDATDYETAERIGRWERTMFIDGSELGRNRRYDLTIRRAVEEGTYEGQGRIHTEILERCVRYFRREPPYDIVRAEKRIVPLPFGIERKYVRVTRSTVKDIDFTCIFGQEYYPELRRAVRLHLEKFCERNGFTYATTKTKTRDEFYDILARTKVGVSVGGGGFDTARFWEILGNNCLLMTETIDIYDAGSDALDYRRIYEFSGLPSFAATLHDVALSLRTGYDSEDLWPEYERIMAEHSTKARAQAILDAARREGIV